MVPIFSWLTKSLAKILLEELKHEHAKDIEEIKKKNLAEVEKIKKEFSKEIEDYKNYLSIFKEDYSRYYGEQFKLYANLWKILCELKNAGNMLWNEATHKNLRSFAELLEKASDDLEKGSLFIESEHYIKMLELVDRLKEYKFGKDKLIEVYNKKDFQHRVGIYDIEKLITDNNNYKTQYEGLLKDVRDSLKDQLKRKINSITQ
jgi:hypothetical protein